MKYEVSSTLYNGMYVSNRDSCKIGKGYNITVTTQRICKITFATKDEKQLTEQQLNSAHRT